MCTVTVNVDEAMLKEMDPNLSDKTAIRRWVQELIDLRIQQMELEDNETMDLEEARAMLHETIRKVYAEGWITYFDAMYQIERTLLRREPILSRWKGYHMANTDKWYFAYTFDGETVTVVDACHAQNMHG